MADDKVRASSSSSSLFTLNLPNGLEWRNWEGCRRHSEKWLRTCREGKPWQPQAGKGTGQEQAKREGDNVPQIKEQADKDGWHRDGAVGWLETIFTSVCLRVHTEGRSAALRSAGTHTHTH